MAAMTDWGEDPKFGTALTPAELAAELAATPSTKAGRTFNAAWPDDIWLEEILAIEAEATADAQARIAALEGALWWALDDDGACLTCGDPLDELAEGCSNEQAHLLLAARLTEPGS